MAKESFVAFSGAKLRLIFHTAKGFSDFFCRNDILYMAKAASAPMNKGFFEGEIFFGEEGNDLLPDFSTFRFFEGIRES